MNGFKKDLFSYQIEAINTAENYIKSESKSDCLIKLPTGTGKTGVIAVVSNNFVGNVLIIVPNATLPEQTAEEISEKFWVNINFTPSEIKKTNILKSGKEIFNINEKENEIFIITIQTLLSIYKTDKDGFNILKKSIDLVVYDEGHREPADEWSSASRQLNKKTILFTATPYRNDNKVYNIDKYYICRYSMKEAIESNHVKTPTFIPIENKELSDMEITSKFINNIMQNNKGQALVRSSNKNDIISLTENLNNLNLSTLGCHSEFKKYGHFYNCGKDVLKCQSNYSVFIHCNMLVEGVNIPTLNALFLLDGFNNMKSTIQQIGRVLRSSTNSIAYVFIPEEQYGEIVSQWEMYLEAETNEGDYLYVDGKFKKKFLLNNYNDVYKEIRFKKQANIYVSNKSMMTEIQQSIHKQMSKFGNLELFKTSEYSDGKLWVICYQRKEPSRILMDNYHFDYSLEYVSIVECKFEEKYYYFYYNSRRYAFPEEITDLNLIDGNEMFYLLPSDVDIRNTKYTSTSNSKIGVRTKNMDGQRLHTIPGTLSERLSFCRNTTGYYEKSKNKVIRYLSSTTSKISEKEDCTYLEYIDWCKQIVGELNNSSQNEFFKRFSLITNKPTSSATSILFEFLEEIKYKDKFVNIPSQVCIVENNEFRYEIDGDFKKGKVSFDSKSGKHIVDIEELFYYFINGQTPLHKYLQKNKFQLFFGDEQIVFYQGIYFKPNIKFTYDSPEELDLWKDIISLDNLNNCKNEKLGDNPNGDFKKAWPIDSVFGTIVDEINKNPLYNNLDYLVCDDLNCEIADFIALNTTDKKIILIHCKHNDSKLSASAFQDVCGQAVKNIAYLISATPDTLTYFKKHVDLWQNDWEIKGHSTKRCVKGNVKNFEVKYKKLLQNPNTLKEVWLVTDGLSKDALKTQLLKKDGDKTNEQFQQLMFILHSTQDSLSQAGVRMKIFCKT